MMRASETKRDFEKIQNSPVHFSFQINHTSAKFGAHRSGRFWNQMEADFQSLLSRDLFKKLQHASSQFDPDNLSRSQRIALHQLEPLLAKIKTAFPSVASRFLKPLVDAAENLPQLPEPEPPKIIPVQTDLIQTSRSTRSRAPTERPSTRAATSARRPLAESSPQLAPATRPATSTGSRATVKPVTRPSTSRAPVLSSSRRRPATPRSAGRQWNVVSSEELRQQQRQADRAVAESSRQINSPVRRGQAPTQQRPQQQPAPALDDSMQTDTWRSRPSLEDLESVAAAEESVVSSPPPLEESYDYTASPRNEVPADNRLHLLDEINRLIADLDEREQRLLVSSSSQVADSATWSVVGSVSPVFICSLVHQSTSSR